MITYLVLTAALGLAEAQAPQADAGKAEAPFVVGEIPVREEEKIEGLLGEPGAPNLKESQDKLSRELLKKGLCNVAHYGEDFCQKKMSSPATFKVGEGNDRIPPDADAMGRVE